MQGGNKGKGRVSYIKRQGRMTLVIPINDSARGSDKAKKQKTRVLCRAFASRVACEKSVSFVDRLETPTTHRSLKVLVFLCRVFSLVYIYIYILI